MMSIRTLLSKLFRKGLRLLPINTYKRQYLIPEDFNPLAYLFFNIDVYKANIDPIYHYFEFGQTEQRNFYFHKQHDIYLTCIMKQEERYLLEWIAYHRNEGFRKFIIGDNGGSDQQTELLKSLHEAKVIRRVDLIGKERPQIAFYNDILSEFFNKEVVLGFIDTDEFMFSQSVDKFSCEILGNLFEDESIGAVAVNWAVFGSSGHLEQSDEFVVQRFTQRAEVCFPPNQHIKSFVRAGASSAFAGNPHAVVLKPDFRYVFSDGTLVEWSPKGMGIAKQVIWNDIRLNHYVLKSREEYDARKLRGSATSVQNTAAKQNPRYFEGFDKNDISDGVNDIRLVALSCEVRRLSNLLKNPYR